MNPFLRWALKFCHDTFATADDNTPCALRIFGVGFAIIATTIYFILAVHTVWVLKTPLDYMGFGTGLASVWGVVAGAIAWKSKAERSRAQDIHPQEGR